MVSQSFHQHSVDANFVATDVSCAGEGGADDWGNDEGVLDTESVSVELDIQPDCDLGNQEGQRHVMVRIHIPESAGLASTDRLPNLERTSSGRIERAAMDVCCVVDISGSMRNRATYEVDGVRVDDGLSYLDIVRHSVKAVAGMLNAQDRFALVAFDHHAEVAFALDFMTDEGHSKAMKALDKLAPRGRTDIRAGLLAGMEALQKPVDDEFREGQRVTICRDSQFKGKSAVVLDPYFQGDTVQVRISEGSKKDIIRSYFRNELQPRDRWRQKSMLLLTDGQVTAYHEPVRALKKYKESHPDFHFQLNTFGFGYDLNSQMLLDLATEGQGTFAFIPDAVIVGTCFINSVCNSLSTMSQNAMLHLKATGGAQLTGSVIGVSRDMQVDASWGRVVGLGPLQFGQIRDVVVPMKIPIGETPYLQATLVYRGINGKECSAEGVGTSRQGCLDAKRASLRSMMVESGYNIVTSLCSARAPDRNCELNRVGDLMSSLKYEIRRAFPDESLLPSFWADVEGRMSKAVDSFDRFNRWGKHYLLALVRAHQLQLCTNFMDVGLQDYGGLLFRGLRDEGDAVFTSLLAPKASVVTRVLVEVPTPARSSTLVLREKRAPSPDMARYYAGCGGG